MATAKLVVKSEDQNSNTNRTTWSKINPSISGAAQFQALETAIRAVYTLSTDTYEDTEYIVTYSVAEEAAQG